MYSNHKAPRSMSRRAVLGAAGAGAVGAAAVTLGVTKAFEENQQSAPAGTTTGPAASSDVAVDQALVDASPVVVYFEPATRQLTVFAGVDERPLDDLELAGRLGQLAQNK